MIRFLFGRPGSGMTERILCDIRTLAKTDTVPVWLIVPEQQVYSAERDILSALPPDARRSFSIISFSRLCDLLADRFGGRTQHALSRAMRTLFMWQNLRELSGLPEIYTTASGDETLCRGMLRATEEFKRNAVSPARLEAAAEHLESGSPLRAKLRDLALISAAYDGLVTEICGQNPSDRLVRAAEQIDAYDFFAGSHVFIDSFTSFTAQEYAVLHSIMKQAAHMTLTFGCADRHDREPQFETVTDTVRRISRLCADAGRTWEDVCLTASDTAISREIALLEMGLWNYDLPLDRMMLPAEAARGQVHLTVCPSLYDEAEAVALHIIEQHEAGIPYGEIAVTVRDTSTWTGVLDAALDRYRIPYFLSARTDLNEKPAARLLLSALGCIARRYQVEDIITLAKTGLCAVSPRDVDYFAEYVETWHLTGRRMTDTAWSMNPDGYTTELTPRGKAILLAANRVRETVMTPLMALERDLKAAETVTDECRALYAYLAAVGVKEQLTAAAEEHLRLGQVREAGEAVRLWSFLCETLATVASVMETAEPLSAAEMSTALSLVFSETDIGSVPARHDCVTVGSADTLRVDNIRVMLLAGLCEGEFPQSVKDDSLLSERDKDILCDLGIELDSRADRRLSEELLYAWRAISKPTDALYLSYSTSTPDGQARTPSAIIGRVTTLLPDLKPVLFSSKLLEDMDQNTRHRTPVYDTVPPATARRLFGEEAYLSQSRLQTYARCPYSYYGAYLLRLREPVEAKLDNLGAGLFLHHVMEQYLRRALDRENRIRPMEPDEVHDLANEIMTAYITERCADAAQNGRLLHLFDRLRQVALVLINSIQTELSRSDFRVAGLEWNTAGRRPGDPLPMVLNLESDRLGPLAEPTPLADPAAYAARVMDANYPESRTPAAESGEHGLPTSCPVQNLTPDGVQGLPILTPPESSPVRLILGGRVDRVDLYRAPDGETVYIRVIDYKSSKHEFTVRSMTEDMNIQLMLYLFTLCSPENRALFADAEGRVPKRVLPAAAVYISPDESSRDGTIRPLRTGIALSEPDIISAVGEDDASLPYLPSVKRDKAGALTGRGLVSPAEMADLQDLLTATIRETATTMYAGCAPRTPSDAACKYCRMRSSCGVGC